MGRLALRSRRALAILAMLLAAWWNSTRAPERQANRWGQVQLQSLRQSRERLLDTLSSLEQRVKNVVESPALWTDPIDQSKLSDELRRAMAGEDIDGIEFEGIDEAGKTRFLLNRPPVFGEVLMSTPRASARVLSIGLAVGQSGPNAGWSGASQFKQRIRDAGDGSNCRRSLG